MGKNIFSQIVYHMRAPKTMKESPISKQAGLRGNLDPSGIFFQDAIKEKGKHWSKLHLDEAYRLNVLIGAAEGFLDWNVVTNQVLFSKKLKEMLGYEESEIGNSVEEWTRRIHPDDLEMTLLAIDRHINGINRYYLREHRIRCKIGNDKWILNKGKIVERDKNGKALRFIVIVKDISHRKKSEIEYQKRLIELNCHNQISKILAKSVLSVSESIENIVHIIPSGFQYPAIAEASVVVHDQIFQTCQYQKSTCCLTKNILLNGKIIGSISVSYPGDNLPENVQIFLKEESDLLFFIAERVSKFIEKREKDVALKHSEESLRKPFETDQFKESKSELLSRMSHELGTPLNTILCYARFLEMGSLSISQRNGVNRILQEGKVLEELVHEMSKVIDDFQI